MIKIYTKENCGKCTMVKTMLKEKNIEFIEKSVESPDDLAELILAGVDISEAPVVEKDGHFYTNKNGLLRFLNK